MGKKWCGFFNHKLTKTSEESAGGTLFRFVEICRCGEHVQKSIPIHDNDLMADINLTKTNYWVDEEASTPNPNPKRNSPPGAKRVKFVF